MVYCTTVKTQTQTNLYLQYIQYCIHGKEVCVGNLRTRNSCVPCCSCQRQIRVKTEPTAMFFLEEYILYSIFYLLFRHRKKVSPLFPLKTWPYIVTRLCHFALSYIPRSFTLYTCISYGCMADSSAMCTAPWSLILRWPTAEFLSIFEEEKNPGSQNKILKLRTLYQRVRFKDK